MEKVLKLYSFVDGVNDTPFPNTVEQVVTSEFSYDAKRMGGAPSISFSAYHSKCLDKLWTYHVYASFNGEKYFIKQIPSSQYSSDRAQYKHEIDLVSERVLLDNVYFYDVVANGAAYDKPVSNSTNFTFFGDINEFAKRLNYSLQYRKVDYSVVVDEGVSSDSKLVSFEDTVFSNAIQESYNTFEIPYYFVGKVIHFGYSDNTISETFKYGINNSLLSIQKQNANYKVVTRITGTGSSDNIPYYYPNDSDDKAAIEASGGIWIMPSEKLLPPIYRETFGEERFYNAKNNTYIIPYIGDYYHFNNEYVEGNPKEHIVNLDDIKPSIVGMVNASGLRMDMFSDFAYDADDNDDFDAEGNYIHPYFFARLRKFDGEFGFNLFEHAIEEDEMVISMTSGSCGACEWVIGVDSNTQKNLVQVNEDGNLVRDADGNVKFGEPQDRQNDTQNYEVWIALKKDINTFGVIMPNAERNYKPSVGDTFVILHIDLPKGYILAAENKLMEELIKYMAENNDEKFNFSISFSRIYFAEHPDILSQLNENARIKIEYDGVIYELYVSSYSYKMSSNGPLPEITVELSDTITVSQNALQTAINNVEQNILDSIGSIDWFKYVIKYFLRKDKEDYTPHSLGVGKNLRVGKTFTIGDFFTMIDGGWIDEHGNAELKTLLLRDSLKVPEIRFNRMTYFEGYNVISPGGGFTVRTVTDNGDGSYDITTDAEEVEPVGQFVDDILTGYWYNFDPASSDIKGFGKMQFRVTAVDYDRKVITLVPKPELNCVPTENLKLAQTGNFNTDGTHGDRQSFIVMDVRDGNCCITYYDGVNTWDPEIAHVGMWLGKKKGATIGGMDASKYSAVLTDVYVAGDIYQIDRITGNQIRVPIDKGVWMDGEMYAYYDRVTHYGSLWLCVAENGTTMEPSPTESAWIEQVSAGRGITSYASFSTANTPYPANTILTFAGKLWISKRETSATPYAVVLSNGARVMQRGEDGVPGYVLSTPLVQSDDWNLLLDVSQMKDGESIEVQYSADKTSWHTTFAQGDLYMRQRVGTAGTWSEAMRIVGENGSDGPYQDFQFAKNTSLTVPPTTGWQDAPPTIGSGEYLWMRTGWVVPPATSPVTWTSVRIGGEAGAKGDTGTSVKNAGEWRTANTPYEPLTIVKMGGRSWLSKVATSNPPLYTLLRGGARVRSNRGYVLSGGTNSTEWELLTSDAVSYSLISSVGHISITKAGTLSPGGFIVYAKQHIGSVEVAYSDGYLVARGLQGGGNGTTTQIAAPLLGNQISVTGLKGFTSIITRLYTNASAASGWTDGYIAEVTVGVSVDGVDGAKGDDGRTGSEPRVRGTFKNGETYVWNEEYHDIILYSFGGNYFPYRVAAYGAKVVNPPTAEGGDANWERAEKFDFVATDLLLSRQIRADEIYTDGIVSRKMMTASKGARVEVYGSEIKVFGNSAMNIRFGVNDDGMAVLEYYNNDGRKLYDLGPNGITKIPITESSWTIYHYKSLGTSIDSIYATAFGAYRGVTYQEGVDYYQYHAKIVAGVMDPDTAQYNGKLFKSKSYTGGYIPDGWYCVTPSSSEGIGAMEAEYLLANPGDYRVLTSSDVPELDSRNETIYNVAPLYMKDLYHYVNGVITERKCAFWNGTR